MNTDAILDFAGKVIDLDEVRVFAVESFTPRSGATVFYCMALMLEGADRIVSLHTRHGDADDRVVWLCSMLVRDPDEPIPMRYVCDHCRVHLTLAPDDEPEPGMPHGQQVAKTRYCFECGKPMRRLP